MFFIFQTTAAAFISYGVVTEAVIPATNFLKEKGAEMYQELVVGDS